MSAIERKRPRHPGEVIEQLILAHHDLDAAREDLLEKQLRYDRLARDLAPLAIPGESRQIYHDVYIPGRGYRPSLIEIWPNGQVHLSEVERGNRVAWPSPDGPEVRPEPPAMDGAHAATDFPEGEGDVPELSDDLIRAALKPEEGDGLWEYYRNHITAGPGRGTE